MAPHRFLRMVTTNKVISTIHKALNLQHGYLKNVPERHGPMGDTMDKQCLQNPLDVVEGVTYAGQTATRHTSTKTHLHI